MDTSTLEINNLNLHITSRPAVPRPHHRRATKLCRTEIMIEQNTIIDPEHFKVELRSMRDLNGQKTPFTITLY